MVSKGRTWNSASNDWQIALPQIQHPLQMCNMIFIWLWRNIILVMWISIQIKEYDILMISEQFLKLLINKESNLMSFVAENKIRKSRNKSYKGDNSWPHQPWCNEMRHFMLEILFNALQETTFFGTILVIWMRLSSYQWIWSWRWRKLVLICVI